MSDAIWTYEDAEDILDNITVRRHFRELDGVKEHRQTQLLAHDGYALHDKNDNGEILEDGTIIQPIYSYQLTTASRNEEWLLTNHEALLITSNIEII